MRCRLGITLSVLVIHLLRCELTVLAAPPLPGSLPPSDQFRVLCSPIELPGGLAGQEGLIVVPENRSASESRKIGIHFLRFAAREPRGKLPPVFFLPGGPGSAYSSKSLGNAARSSRFSTMSEARRYNRFRDVVFVNQRGNASGPDRLSRDLVFETEGYSLDQPRSFEKESRALAHRMKAAVDRWQSKGMDLAGYDIINMVDDVDDLRQALGYEKIALRGASFGSQWSLAYMRRWPQHVDRAVLTGVEPLDHAYDSPQGIWNTFQRIEQLVRAEGKIRLPDVGLTGAIKEIVQRLEENPVVFRAQHPGRKTFHAVALGVDDFRTYVRYRTRLSPRATLEVWPKFILEIYNEDYGYLGTQIVQHRPRPRRPMLLEKLVNNSLGISNARREQFQEQPATRFLGDINWSMTATAGVTPTPVVEDSFREFENSEIPVLMIHGDLDLSTPLENAHHLLGQLANGHLIRVNGGTHWAIREITTEDPDFADHLDVFMETDFNKTDPQTLFQTMPQSVDLPPLKFESLDGPTMFQQRMGRSR